MLKIKNRYDIDNYDNKCSFLITKTFFVYSKIFRYFYIHNYNYIFVFYKRFKFERIYYICA